MFETGPANSSRDKYYHEFVFIYNTFYDDLYRFGLRLSMNTDMTKDGIQEVFTDLWAKRHKISHIVNVKGYLLKHLSRVIYAAIKKMRKTRRLINFLNFKTKSFLITKTGFSIIMKTLWIKPNCWMQYNHCPRENRRSSDLDFWRAMIMKR